jgi:hypothetical protein
MQTCARISNFFSNLGGHANFCPRGECLPAVKKTAVQLVVSSSLLWTHYLSLVVKLVVKLVVRRSSKQPSPQMQVGLPIVAISVRVAVDVC